MKSVAKRAATDCYGFFGDNLLNKLRIDCIRPGMGRVIGPKTWDQNCGIVLEFLDSREPP